MRIQPMISGITISIDRPEIAFADDRSGLSLAAPAHNLEDRHLRGRIDPEPFLPLAFRPSRLIDMVDRLLMHILLRCLHRLL